MSDEMNRRHRGGEPDAASTEAVPNEAFEPRLDAEPTEPTVEVSLIPLIRSAHADPEEPPHDVDGSAGWPDGAEPVPDASLVPEPEDADEPVRPDIVVPPPVAGAALPDAPVPSAAEPIPTSVLSTAEAVTEEEQRRRRRRLRRAPKDKDRGRAVYEESLPTQAIALAGRLSASSYGSRVRSRVRSAREVDDAAVEARTTLDFALKLGETMFRFGASSMDVESSIIVVTQSFGIHETEVDLTNQAISLNYAPDSSRGEVPYTLQRVVRNWSTNFAGLGALYRLVEQIADGDVTRSEAQRRLVEIRRMPKPYPGWAEIVAAGVMTGAFIPFIGGNWFGAGVGMVSTWIVFGLAVFLENRGLPEIFSTVAGAFLATVIALGLHAADLPLNPAVVVAGGILVLLPTARFVMAVQDAIHGFPLTAGGRLVSALLVYVGIMGGIMIGVVSAEMLGIPQLDLAEEPQGKVAAVVVLVLVTIAAMMHAVVMQAKWSTMLASGVVSGLGFLSFEFFDAIGAGSRLTPAAAATVVGLVGRMFAVRMGYPSIVVVLSSTLFLLPGLAIFRSLYGFTVETDSTLLGVAGIFNAFVIIIAIAAGVALGDTLARPITDRFFENARRPAAMVVHQR